jgi:hypothetical protein
LGASSVFPLLVSSQHGLHLLAGEGHALGDLQASQHSTWYIAHMIYPLASHTVRLKIEISPIDLKLTD